jgi:hypothetical protein
VGEGGKKYEYTFHQWACVSKIFDLELRLVVYFLRPLGLFYAPAMKWLGAYSVTLRHSVFPIIGFRSLSLERLHTFN